MEVIKERPSHHYRAAFPARVIKDVRVNLAPTDVKPRLAGKVELSLRNIIWIKVRGQAKAAICINRHPAVLLIAPILVYPVIITLAMFKIWSIAGAHASRNTFGL